MLLVRSRFVPLKERKPLAPAEDVREPITFVAALAVAALVGFVIYADRIFPHEGKVVAQSGAVPLAARFPAFPLRAEAPGRIAARNSGSHD